MKLTNFLFSLMFCLSLSVSAEPRQLQLKLGDQMFSFVVAADPDSRRDGLMGRELAPQTGMLFDFPEGTRPAIWMYNMQISLDLLFVGAGGHVQYVFAEVAPCQQTPCDIYQAAAPLRYVLEVPAGTVQALGIKVGDQLDMSGLPAAPPAL